MYNIKKRTIITLLFLLVFITVAVAQQNTKATNWVLTKDGPQNWGCIAYGTTCGD